MPAADRMELEAGVNDLAAQIEGLRASLRGKPALLELLPDVQIYYNAVRYALQYNEFFNAREIGAARNLLREGSERATALRGGLAPWTAQTGLVARGYVSRIDGSVQPYGLVVPASYNPNSAHRFRLDIWYHGRGETLSEVNFISDRERSAGEFTPQDTIVLHPYGRYCNANRFAGEVDTFEALDSVRRRYRIDENRILVRGFSMGGAACWMFATHYAGEWAAAAPGAGFSETRGFLNIPSSGADQPPWYEQKLWHLYDSTDYAENLAGLPTVAYSGELDGQRQAAVKMAEALAVEGITMEHVIGAQAHHFYTPAARAEIERRLDSIAARGRDSLPRHLRFTTWTLRYNRLRWLVVDGLEAHWERARVEAWLPDDHTARLNTKNVAALTLDMAPGECPLDVARRPRVVIDGQAMDAAPVLSDRSWTAHFRKENGRWSPVASAEDGALRKRHGLQGPIDDAFMDSFLMVRPTGAQRDARAGAWVANEMQHAITHWRIQFRGEARVKDDTAVTDQDIAESNLVLWGDPASNRILARIADRLPIRWDGASIHAGAKVYPAAGHVPVMIYPNPLNPKRYVVLNSGFTFREYDYLNNARQTPKLPDYAILDVTTPPDARTPGKVVDAGFFDEEWKLK